MIGFGLLSRFDRMNSKDSAKVLALVLLASVTIENTALFSLAAEGISCICSSISGIQYSLLAQENPHEHVKCGEGDLEECYCYDANGDEVEIDIPQVDWSNGVNQLQIDLTCTSPLFAKSNEDESDSFSRKKRDTREETRTETKSNILSRSIKGVGSIADGVGSSIGVGVDAIGTAAGSTVTGGFHLLGTVTKKVSEGVGGAIKAVGGVFERSKVITSEIDDHSNSDDKPAGRIKRSVPQAGPIATKQDMTEAVASLDYLGVVVDNVKRILNKHSNVADAKIELQGLANSTSDSTESKVYRDYAELIVVESLDHDVDEVEVIDTISKAEGANTTTSVWTQISQYTGDSKDIYELVPRMRDDKKLNTKIGGFVSYLDKKMKSELQCSSLTDSMPVGVFITLADVAEKLRKRRGVCGEEDSESLQPILDAIDALPKHRGKRSVTGEGEAVSKSRSPKHKPKSSKRSRKSSKGGKRRAGRKGGRTHSKAELSEHAKERVHGNHHDDEEEYEDDYEEEARYDDEEDYDDEAPEPHQECRCDPDTHVPL